MQEFKLSLSTIHNVNSFVQAIRNINCDLDLVSEDRHYVVDAKSIMGVLSLDLSKELTLKAYTTSEETIQAIAQTVADFKE